MCNQLCNFRPTISRTCRITKHQLWACHKHRQRDNANSSLVITKAVTMPSEDKPDQHCELKQQEGNWLKKRRWTLSTFLCVREEVVRYNCRSYYVFIFFFSHQPSKWSSSHNWFFTVKKWTRPHLICDTRYHHVHISSTEFLSWLPVTRNLPRIPTTRLKIILYQNVWLTRQFVKVNSLTLLDKKAGVRKRSSKKRPYIFMICNNVLFSTFIFAASHSVSYWPEAKWSLV